MFLVSTVLLGIIVLLLVYSNIALLVYHAPTYSRPFDMGLIHAPLRFFMILPLSLMFPYSLLSVVCRSAVTIVADVPPLFDAASRSVCRTPPSTPKTTSATPGPGSRS